MSAVALFALSRHVANFITIIISITLLVQGMRRLNYYDKLSAINQTCVMTSIALSAFLISQIILSNIIPPVFTIINNIIMLVGASYILHIIDVSNDSRLPALRNTIIVLVLCYIVIVSWDAWIILFGAQYILDQIQNTINSLPVQDQDNVRLDIVKHLLTTDIYGIIRDVNENSVKFMTMMMVYADYTRDKVKFAQDILGDSKFLMLDNKPFDRKQFIDKIDKKVITQKFRRSALKYHPDKSGKDSELMHRLTRQKQLFQAII